MIKIDTKADIDRLGNLIREEKGFIKEETLVGLQNFRTSHKETISLIFNFLCSISNKIHPQTIVTYRIKRFESIISKLYRYPEMRFSRMWDIGGCRCITRNNNDVYKFKDFIVNSSEFEIIKEKDYITEPQNDGYKSLHLFVKKKGGDKIIEVQLRNQIDHNWATLVEISDLLYGSNLKELGIKIEETKFKDLFKFHLLLSEIGKTTNNEKKEIARIIKKYEYFERLSAVFSRNYVKVRKQWFQIESRNHKYFLIESSKSEVPKIISFDSSINAEEHYFNVYRNNRDAYIVLTHLHRPNYNQISIAYSNYILTFHSFLIECLQMVESLILEALEKGKYYEYYKAFNLYSNLVFHHIMNLNSEIIEFNEFSKNITRKKNNDRKKEREWIEDIKIQIINNRDRAIKLNKKLNKSIPRDSFKRFIFIAISKYLNKRLNYRIKKVLNNKY